MPDWVPGGMVNGIAVSTSDSAEAMSASRVGSEIVVPSAAAVIGTVTWQSRSALCRVKTGWAFTCIST